MSQYQPKTITLSMEEYERMQQTIATMEQHLKEVSERNKDLRDHQNDLRDWLYAYKEHYAALTQKYCLPCTVGWHFSKN